MSDEKTTPEEKPPLQWEYKTQFGINEKLKTVVERAIDASVSEVERLKRQIDKLTYGS